MRLCKNGWLQTYLEYTAKQESPECFHVWSALSVIAGALSRKCWVDRGYFKTYPNQYILLVSQSALCKKGTAAEIALGIYNSAFPDLHVIDRKLTMQKLIANLAHAKKVTGFSFCFLYNSELSTLIGRKMGNTELMDYITAMYTCPDKWLYETKTQGNDYVEKGFLNFLSCTTPSDLNDMPSSLVGGGLSGRIMFVFSETPRPPEHNPKLHMTVKAIRLREDLVKDLIEISKIDGEYSITPDADSLHKEIYDTNYYKKNTDFRLEPYRGRKGEHLIKVAMLLSASRGDNLLIERCDMEAANTYLEELERGTLSAFDGLGHVSETQHLERVIKYIVEERGSIQHSLLLKKMYRFTNAKGLEDIVNTLSEGGDIKIDIIRGVKYYTLTKVGGK